MNQKKKERKKWSWKAFGRWLATSGGATAGVFSWELLEEVLENVIALGISSFIAILSTFLLISATQFVKIVFKKLLKLLFPLVKQLIYKEGNDKMTMLKNYWTKVWGNKITGFCSAVPFSAMVYFAFDFTKVWFTVLAVALAFIIAFNIAVFFGGETLAQIQARIADVKLSKQEKQNVKDIEATMKELEKQSAKLNAEKLYAQAKTIVEQKNKEKAQQPKS